jgi:hypothetical protein
MTVRKSRANDVPLRSVPVQAHAGAPPAEQRRVAISRRAVYETVAVAATALLHPAFVDVLHMGALFNAIALVAIALVGCNTYICWRARREPEALRQLGLRREGLGPAFLATSGFSLVALPTMGMIAQTQNTLAFRWQLLVLLGPVSGVRLIPAAPGPGLFVEQWPTGHRSKIAATVFVGFALRDGTPSDQTRHPQPGLNGRGPHAGPYS